VNRNTKDPSEKQLTGLIKFADSVPRLKDGISSMQKTSTSPHLGTFFLASKKCILTCSPPDSCSVNFNRDCAGSGGCVISALKEQTAVLSQCLSNNDVSTPCVEALKFVVHFMGDITQPLHCSSWERGGNEIEVNFGNRKRNLHSVSSVLKLC